MSSEADGSRRSSSSVWPRSPKRRRNCEEESPQRFRPDSRHVVLDRDRVAKCGSIFSLGHGRSVNILFVEAGDYVDIRACPEKNCDLVYAENEFGMKAHVSPSIISTDEVRFFCVFCTSSHPNFESEAILNKHIVDAHFYSKFEKGLKKKAPFNCPFSYCRFNGSSVQDLVYHYAGPEHHVFQRILTKAKYDLILKNKIDATAASKSTSGGWCFEKAPTLKVEPKEEVETPVVTDSLQLRKEIEAKAFNELYVDEKRHSDKLQAEIKNQKSEIEGLKKEWHETKNAKRVKENELKELKLKYDVLKGKYENDVYGRKTPKKVKDEREEMKREIEKLTKQVETLTQKAETMTQKAETMTQKAESLSRENKRYEEDIVSGKVREADWTKMEDEVEEIKKRSRARFFRCQRQKKILTENENEIRDLKTRLEVSVQKLATLEQDNSELENLNSAVELELKTETDNFKSKVAIFESEKADLESRIRMYNESSIEMQQKLADMKKEMDEKEKLLERSEENLKMSSERIEKLKDQVSTDGKFSQQVAQLKNDNMILEKRLLSEPSTDGTCQALQAENLVLRRQLEKYKASLNLRDQEIQLLRQFDEDQNFNNNINVVDSFIKSESGLK